MPCFTNHPCPPLEKEGEAAEACRRKPRYGFAAKNGRIPLRHDGISSALGLMQLKVAVDDGL